MQIREFNQPADEKGLRDCIVELQEFERALDPRMPGGMQIADAYFSELKSRCEKHDGKIFVADVDGEIAGYAAVLTKLRSEDLEDGDLEYGLVADLVVLKRFRRRGIGRRLLSAVEQYACHHQVRWLRVGVLAENLTARAIYASIGFHEHLLQLEKDLSPSDQSR